VTNKAIVGHENAFINWYSPALAGSDWRMLMCLPMTHALGINMGINWCLVAGGTVILLETPTSDAIIEAMNIYEPTIWIAVPALINQIVYHSKIKKSKIGALKLVLVGSAPLAKKTFSTFKKYTNARVVEGFGMTEAICAVTFNPTNGGKLGSIGVPFIDTDVLIVDSKDGNTVMDPNQKGEIIYRSLHKIKEYWHKPEETAKAIRNGWMFSGDIGYMDEDGYFYIVDRKKDMIIVGGFNVFPREIDEVLFKHPKIFASCTVGIPDSRLGEVAMSFIVLKPNEVLKADEILAYCRKNLTAYKVPRLISFIKQIPLTKANKPDKELLKKTARDMALKTLYNESTYGREIMEKRLKTQ
jgi:long-chain acyl-CoA synthetase